MSQSVYSFLDVNATLVGPGGYINLGAGAGVADEGITLSPTGDISGMVVGADGTGQHNLYADKSGRVMVRLLKTSPTNRQLSLMYALQTAASSAHGQNTIVVNTGNGDVHTCFQVAFAKKPDFTYAKDADIVTWEFNAIRIESSLGAS